MGNFIFGVLSGFATSFGIWFWRNYISPPKMNFGNSISKRSYSDGEFGYFIIYKNIGKRRLIDPLIKVTLRIPGLVKSNSQLAQVVFLETSAKDRFVIPLDKAVNTKILCEESNSINHNKYIPDNLKKKALAGCLELEELFALSEDTSLQVSILGNDEGTGLRKMFESKQYKLNDIREGSFDRETLEVIEQEVANKS